MNKKFIKTAGSAGVILGGLYFLAGRVAYELALNRKKTDSNNQKKIVTDDIYKFYPSADDAVNADDWFVAMHPTDMTTKSMSGKTLHAIIFKQKNYTPDWVIINHGYTSGPRDFADQAFHFYKDLGCNILMPSLGSFNYDEDKYSTMGYKDRFIVMGWIDYIINEDPKSKIAILGVSMGSATTMNVTGEKLPSNVKCAVADCGYSDCWDQMANTWKNMSGMGPFPVMTAANTIAKIRYGWDFKKNRPVDAVSRSVTPTLFIHGEKDKFVPYEMLDVVYNACTAEKKKVSVPDAAHAESNKVHPEIYYPNIYDWFSKYMK